MFSRYSLQNSQNANVFPRISTQTFFSFDYSVNPCYFTVYWITYWQNHWYSSQFNPLTEQVQWKKRNWVKFHFQIISFVFKLWIHACNKMAGTSFFLFLFFFSKASCCYSSVRSAEMYCLQYAINELLNALNESHSKCNCLCSPEAQGQAWRRSCQWNRAVFNLHLMTFTHIHEPCYNLTQERGWGGGERTRGNVSRVGGGVFVHVWKKMRERQNGL